MMFFRHIHHFNRRADRFFGQGKILTAILRKGSMTQNELLEIVDSERPSVDGMLLSETLAELEKRRLVKRSKQRCEDKRGDIFTLTKMGEMFARRFQNLNRHADRFFGQGPILTAILRKGPATQSELLKIVDSERPSVDGMSFGKTLAELEKRRLIKRSKRQREDKQGDVFSLTKKGEIFAKRFQVHEYFTQNISKSLSDEEKEQLTTILEKLRSDTGGGGYSHFHFRGSHFDFDGRSDRHRPHEHSHDHHDHTHGKADK
jgi:DNA-binding MarR family transcriptional regulator